MQFCSGTHVLAACPAILLPWPWLPGCLSASRTPEFEEFLAGTSWSCVPAFSQAEILMIAHTYCCATNLLRSCDSAAKCTRCLYGLARERACSACMRNKSLCMLFLSFSSKPVLPYLFSSSSAAGCSMQAERIAWGSLRLRYPTLRALAHLCKGDAVGNSTVWAYPLSAIHICLHPDTCLLVAVLIA